jgi:copper resistance protein B
MNPLLALIGVAGALAMPITPAAAQTPPVTSPPAPLGTVESGHPVMDNLVFVHGTIDQLEGRTDGRVPELRWSAQGWIGTDYDKFRVKTEGQRRNNGEIDDGRHEFLYSRAVSTYFDLQAGLRSDLDSRRVRNWAAFGIQGLEPLFVEVEGTAYISDKGHVAARFEGSYDLLLTNRLILEPKIEVNLQSAADRARLVGAGLTDIEAGLRLRYEFTRKFAPYIGVSYDGKFGQTASLARRAGESTSELRFVFGVRSWF